MTRRTKNVNIVNEDILLVHPKDAKKRDLNTILKQLGLRKSSGGSDTH